MPNIPTYQPLDIPSHRLSPGGVAVPQAPGSVRATADVFGGGEAAAALAKASAAWANAGAAFQHAEAETLYQNEKLALRKKVLEFEIGNPQAGVKGLAERTDYQNFEPEFDALMKATWKDYQERIQNPGVLQALQMELSTLAMQKSTGVSKLVRDKQVEYGRGAYASRQAEYYNQFAISQDGDERTRIINDARSDIRATIAAGYIKPEDGVKDMGKFLERTSVQSAQEEIRKNPETFDPDRFPFLSMEHRISLSDQAGRRVEQAERERVRLEEKRERENDKAAKEWRDQNARGLWVKEGKGLTIMEVEDAILKRHIDLDEGKALRKALAAEDKVEDPVEKFVLRTDIEEGRAGKREIISAYNKGVINRTTLEQYQQLYYTRQRADDVSKHPEYKDAEHYITNQLKTTGPMSKFDTSELPRIEMAKDEFDKRVRKGEPILDVRNDIVKRYRPEPLSVDAFPRPVYGSRDNPAEAFRLTEQAFRENRIDYDTYRREILNLRQIQETLDRTNTERGAQNPEEHKKKLKARKD